MKIEYASTKVEAQCTSLKEARQLFGGDNGLAVSLMSRINSINSAETIKDIVLLPPLHFHALKNKDGKNLDGYFDFRFDAHFPKSRFFPVRIYYTLLV